MDNTSGSDPNYLYRAVGTDFPVGEFTFMWHVRFVTNRVNEFQTYCAIAKTAFVGDNEYYIMGFDGNGGVSHNFAIGSQGNDTYHATESPVVDKWFKMGFVRRDLGGGDYSADLYLDLPATKKVTRDWEEPGGAFTVVAAERLVFGSVPYSNFEGIDGWMRSCNSRPGRPSPPP